MAHHDQVNASIEKVICEKYPESCGKKWLNNKPSGPAWQMTSGKWKLVLQEILDDLETRVTACVPPTIDDLGDTLDEHLHEIRTAIDEKIKCKAGAHP